MTLPASSRYGALLCGALALCWLWLPPARVGGAQATPLTDAELVRIEFEQKLDAQVSLGLIFRDETGRLVRLGDCVGNKPTILVPGYYGCPMLCTLVLNGLVDSLLDLKPSIGREFNVVNVSIDPKERPALAAAKKRTYLKRYGRPGAAEGWRFLTGEEAVIRDLTGAVGFHYAYDPASKQYAHPSGIVVLTPQGKVARYFFGLEFPPQELSNTLRDAGSEKVGSPIAQLILLCFHYSPLRGRFGQTILLSLRLAGILTVLVLAGLVLRAVGKNRKRALLPGLPALAPAAKPNLRPSGEATP